MLFGANEVAAPIARQDLDPMYTTGFWEAVPLSKLEGLVESRVCG